MKQFVTFEIHSAVTGLCILRLFICRRIHLVPFQLSPSVVNCRLQRIDLENFPKEELNHTNFWCALLAARPQLDRRLQRRDAPRRLKIVAAIHSGSQPEKTHIIFSAVRRGEARHVCWPLAGGRSSLGRPLHAEIDPDKHTFFDLASAARIRCPLFHLMGKIGQWTPFVEQAHLPILSLISFWSRTGLCPI